jgi:hypothetical protein
MGHIEGFGTYIHTSLLITDPPPTSFTTLLEEEEKIKENI